MLAGLKHKLTRNSQPSKASLARNLCTLHAPAVTAPAPHRTHCHQAGAARPSHLLPCYDQASAAQLLPAAGAGQHAAAAAAAAEKEEQARLSEHASLTHLRLPLPPFLALVQQLQVSSQMHLSSLSSTASGQYAVMIPGL